MPSDGWPPIVMRVRRLREVEEFTGLKRTQIFAHVAAGNFPPPIKLTDTGRAIGWLESELLEWLAKRVAAREAANKTMPDKPTGDVLGPNAISSAARRTKTKTARVSRPKRVRR